MSIKQKIFWFFLLAGLAGLDLVLILWMSATHAPNPEPISIESARALSLPFVSAASEINAPKEESPLAAMHIDSFHQINTYLKISGWIYVKNQPTAGQKVYIQFQKPDRTIAHYSTMPVERPDIAVVFENPLYAASGFCALIPLADGFDFNAYKMSIVIQNEKGIYKKSKPGKPQFSPKKIRRK